jgi:hypothetical protein
MAARATAQPTTRDSNSRTLSSIFINSNEIYDFLFLPQVPNVLSVTVNPISDP